MSDSLYFVTDEFALIRLLKDSRFMHMASPILRPEHFTKQEYKWLYRHMLAGFERLNEVPSPKSLFRELKRACEAEDQQALALYDSIKKILTKFNAPIKNQNHALEDLVNFVKRQSWLAAMQDATRNQLLNSREGLESLEDKFRKCFAAGEIPRAAVTNLVSDIDAHVELKERQEEEGAYYAGTGVLPFDLHLQNHGIGPGQLGIFAAPPNRGKSFALSSVALEGLFNKKRVLLVSLEMSADSIIDRLWSAITGGLTNNLRGETFKQFRDSFLGKFKEATAGLGEISIADYPTGRLTVGALRSDIERTAELDGWLPDLIVVDYGDIMRPQRQTDSLYRDQGSIFTELRAMAREMNVPVWTASQGNRGSMGKMNVTGSDIAGSHQKLEIADVVITLNQTDEERDQRIMRMLLEKSRGTQRGVTFEFHTGFEWGRFCLGPVLDKDDVAAADAFEDRVRPVNSYGERRPVDWLPQSLAEERFH